MAEIVFIISFFGLFFVLSWKRPKWALAAAIAGMPAYLVRMEAFGVPTTLLELMILALFFSWLARAFLEKKKPFASMPFKWLILAWLSVAAISVIASPDKRAALGILKAYFVEPAMLFAVFFDIVKQKKDLCLVVRALAVSALAVSAYAVLQKFTGWGIANPFWRDEATRRTTGFFEYPNALGLYLGPIAVLLLARFLSEVFSFGKFGLNKKISALLLLSIAILSALACFYAQSEGAIVGMMVGAASLAFLLAMRRAAPSLRRRIVPVIMLSAFAVLLAYPFLSMKFVDQYEVPEFELKLAGYIYEKATLKDLSGEIRKQGWREAWAMLKDNPVFGAGLAGFREKIAPYHQDGIFYNFDKDPDFRRKTVVYNEEYRAKYWQPVEIFLYPHHLILNFWSELGLAGLIIFCLIIGKLFVVGFRRGGGMSLSSMAAMSALLAHGLVDVPYFKNDLAVLFWLIIGIALAGRRENAD